MLVSPHMKHIITIFAILFFAPSFVFASTPVSGTLPGNTTWSSGNVYIVSDLTVPAGITLTVQPGVIIKFNGLWDRISVLGTLSAVGDAGNPIYFTSINDNSVGGSTGTGNPNPSDWAQIVISGNGTATFDHAVIRYGGYYYTGANVYNNGGTLNISNSEISYASAYGIYHNGGTTTAQGNQIKNNNSYGVYAVGSGTLSLTGNTFSNNTNGATSFNYGSGLVVTNSGNTSSGTGPRGFIMAGSLSSDQEWGADGLPYIISDLTIPEGKTLTIDPGAIIKFNGLWDRISVLGTLNAKGTADKPIYFTSIKDDSIGGDTNGDDGANSPLPSDWAQIVISNTGSATFDHAVVRYGGYYYTGANVYNNGGTLKISNSTISSASAYGVYHNGGTTSVENSAIKNNNSYGVYAVGDGTLSLVGNTFSDNSNAAASLNFGSGLVVTNSGNVANGTGLRGFIMAGSLSSNQIWNEDGLPYIISDLTIPVNKILIINQGATIKFNGLWDRISVLGTLDARGTIDKPIHFTSIKDDSVLGDTNADGLATKPAPSDWAQIVTLAGGITKLDFAIVSYGGYYYTGANLYNNGGTLNISNSISDNASAYGIYHNGGTTSFEKSSASDNGGYGIYAVGSGDITINDNSFFDNANAAASLNFGGGLVVNNSENIASGKGLHGFIMAGSLTASQHWVSETLPYIISDLTVPIGQSLTIDAGAVIKFNGLWDRISVLGTLDANGTASQPIYFTSIKDDTILGDTNGDGITTLPSPSDWAQMITLTGGKTTLKNAVVRYGGYYYTGADVYNNGGTLAISSSTIAYASAYGVYHNGGISTVNGSALKNNGSYGVYAVGDGSIGLVKNIFSDNPNGAASLNFGSGLVVANSGNTANGAGTRGLIMTGSLTSSQHWVSESLPYIISDLTVPVNQTLTIDPGAVIKFNGIWDRISVLGTLDTEGTSAKPIYLTSIKDDTIGGDTNGDDNITSPKPSDWAQIVTLPGGTSIFKHAVIRYGGYYYTGANLNNSGGTLSISYSTTEKASAYGIYHTGGTSNIDHNAIQNNGSYGVYNSTANYIDAINNYWGDASGPYHSTQNLHGTGNRVSDNVNFKPFLTEDPTGGDITPPPPTPTRTPVLFVPGTLGTEIKKGNTLLWADLEKMIQESPLGDRFMDPLAFNQDGTPTDSLLTVGNVLGNPQGRFDYTAGLLSEFMSRGYTVNTDFFLFPYDWRGDITDNADGALINRIDTILSQTGSGKIDIIAHSQGGLLIKKFLLDNPKYDSKIRKIVFLGTPNLGSPKSARTLLEGDDLGVEWKLNNVTMLQLDSDEVKRISLNMPAIYEMLPSREYFSQISGYLGTGKTIYDYTTTKQKLIDDGLNSSLISLAENFHSVALDNFSFSGTGIDVWNIVGCQQPTVTQILQKGTNFNDVTYKAGDGTVPFFSATHLGGASTLYALKVEHGTMPSNEVIRAQIADILTSETVQTRAGLTTNPSTCHFNGVKVSVHSPADLNVYDPQGRHLGPNTDGSFDTQIPGVAYDTIGEEKFAFLPELPTGQTYTVKLIATGAGTMSFVSEKVEESSTVNTAVYFDVPISVGSTADIALTDANTQPLVLHPDANSSQTILPSLGTGDALPDTLAPKTTTSATGTKGQNGWYTSDVTVTLSATDLPLAVSSGVNETKYSLDKGVTLKTYDSASPLVITTEGTTTIQYYSTDNAGNKEATSTLEIKIDKTAPEAKVSVDATTKDLLVAGVDLNPTTVTKDASNTYTITDLAGHTTKLFFQKTFLGKLLTFAKLTGVQYDTATKVILPSSSFVYLWNPLANPPVLLSQTIVVNDTYGIEAVYDKSKNQTTVLLKKKGVQIQKQTFTGLRVIKLTTSKSVVGYEI